MSVNVYLKSEEVKEKPGFEDHENVVFSISEIKLWNSDGRWHIMLKRLEDPIPPSIADIVEEITFLKEFSLNPIRKMGIYSYGSARAEVDMVFGKKIGPRFQVFITAKKKEDLQELYEMIRAGSVFPDKNKNYESQQKTGFRRMKKFWKFLQTWKWN
ncbi:MAG: hypothetical protein KJ879_00840 [Nanoarchaeota archaeon]|nr:hypothetical protein [Nanoarchaeota archaeon]